MKRPGASSSTRCGVRRLLWKQLNLDASQEAPWQSALSAPVDGRRPRLGGAGSVMLVSVWFVLLFGLIKLTEIHELGATMPFGKPSEEFSNVMTTAYELLGAIHIVTVEDQVIAETEMIVFDSDGGDAVLLSAAFSTTHQVGGLSFHKVTIGRRSICKISGLCSRSLILPKRLRGLRRLKYSRRLAWILWT